MFCRRLAPLLLAAAVLAPLQATEAYGRIRIQVPGAWSLVLFDREEDPRSSHKFPFYVNDRPGDLRQSLEWARPFKGAEGFLTLLQEGGPVGQADLMTLAQTGESCGLTGGKDYQVVFPYGMVGLKVLHRVLHLYGKDRSSALIHLEVKRMDKGPVVRAKLLAQADHDPVSRKFKAGKNDVYRYTLNGKLAMTPTDLGSNLLLEVTQRSPAPR